MLSLIFPIFISFTHADSGEFFYPEEKDREGWGKACYSNKDQQSPIDLPFREDLHRQPLVKLHSASSLWTFHNEEALGFKPTNPNTPDGSVFELDVSAVGLPTPAKLDQFHIHIQSEHLVMGEQFAAEVHFVHTTPDTPSGLLVTGIFLELQPEPTEEVDLLLDIVESVEPGQQFVVDINQFFRNINTGKYWDYMGSLTTPPCTLGVKWIVMSDKVGISFKQLGRLAASMGGIGNFRRPQPVGDREVGPLSELHRLANEARKNAAGVGNQNINLKITHEIPQVPTVPTVILQEPSDSSRSSITGRTSRRPSKTTEDVALARKALDLDTSGMNLGENVSMERISPVLKKMVDDISQLRKERDILSNEVKTLERVTKIEDQIIERERVQKFLNRGN